LSGSTCMHNQMLVFNTEGVMHGSKGLVRCYTAKQRVIWASWACWHGPHAVTAAGQRSSHVTTAPVLVRALAATGRRLPLRML
jgi:hypothetical protein